MDPAPREVKRINNHWPTDPPSSVGDPDPHVLGLPSPDPLVRGADPDPLVRGADPDPSLFHKCVERTETMPAK
jgi:hypothetical protein